jgi:exosortase
MELNSPVSVADIAGEADSIAPAAARPRGRNTIKWRTAVPRVVAASVWIAGALWVARQTWRDIFLIAWGDPESSHVFLVPLVFLWLAWDRRHALQFGAPRNRWIGSLAIGLGWLLWSCGYRFEVQCFWHGGAILMALGAMLTVVGADPFFALLPAFGAIVFLVPVPGTGRELVALPLQRVTARATQVTAELVGMSIERTGSLLRINGVDVAVAEACNGMRLVFTLFLACYVFTFITPLRWQIRLIILLMSPVVAVTANVVRLVPTVWVYAHGSHEAAERFHDASGWAMLVAAFLGLMGVVRLLRWVGIPVDHSPQPAAG